MKTTTIILTLLLCVSTAFGSAQYIICGWQPGEIYFIGPTKTGDESSGFYHSYDHGQTITLIDSIGPTNPENFYGNLLVDVEDSTIHRFYYASITEFQHLLSHDGGYSWEHLYNHAPMYPCYTAGTLPGEIYRRSGSTILQIERSTTFGYDYLNCSTTGFPDTTWIYSIAAGISPGEVYLIAYGGGLYYSLDYAENFAYLGNIQQSFGVQPMSALIHGVQPGEVYAHKYESGRVWRISNYGTNADLIMDYGVSCPKGLAVTSNPGEMYYYFTNYVECIPDPYGIMQIWHTTDYFQTWTEYEHIIDLTGIKSEISAMPSKITLQVYPNPANPSFSIAYNLQTRQTVEIGLFNINGQKVWSQLSGSQMPGEYQLTLTNGALPSGIYMLQLQTEVPTITRKITILK